ncbi:hypothetical protein [Brevundimonas sp. SH203]|uniref:hypothetical protein n=1 Tax=Brevundimonas sp. SH203 TaxID=345167 RepID=UPI000B354868|nr:hypothetical protein [Brevundimonas sp. SH203]
MSDLRTPLGFEEALRPPIDVRRARITRPVLRPPGQPGDAAAYAQLARIIRRAPEVMVRSQARPGTPAICAATSTISAATAS